MNRFRKLFLQDRIFLTLLLCFGVVMLTVTKGWGVYADPVKEGGAWLMAQAGIGGEESGNGAEGMSDTGGQEANRDGGSGVQPGMQQVSDGEQSGGKLSDEQNVPGEAGGGAANADGISSEENGEETGETVIYETVEDDYFADALFIGDSRTVGLFEYGGLEEISAFYASTGLTVQKLFDAKIVSVPDQKQKITVEEALTDTQFAKIYLMIGINEMGTGTPEYFLKKYRECVDHIRELQPDAVIYLQSIMQVTAERSAKGDYITNEGIDVRNAGIKAMADNQQIFYLNVNEAVCGDDGTLIADYTHDGVHLKAQYIPLWKDYLKEHAVVRAED